MKDEEASTLPLLGKIDSKNVTHFGMTIAQNIFLLVPVDSNFTHFTTVIFKHEVLN